jgi:hypothetical protein
MLPALCGTGVVPVIHLEENMRRSLVVLLALAAIACKQSDAPEALAKSEKVAKPAASAPAAEAVPPAGNMLKGKVLERLEAAPYSYLRLSTGSGEVWAAVPQTKAAEGTEVTVADAFPMKDFESKTLKRKFDVVYFGTLGDPNAAAPAAAGAGAIPPGHPPTSGDGSKMGEQHKAAAAGPSDVKDVKVEKASGPDARTVAEIYAQHTDLKEKPITVRGQVVKFNAGIMGRNWVHLRDGTGSLDKADNDITVTTNDQVAVGDVVTAKGTVRLDKDFGAGYTYPVIIEDAKVSK